MGCFCFYSNAHLAHKTIIKTSHIPAHSTTPQSFNARKLLTLFCSIYSHCECWLLCACVQVLRVKFWCCMKRTSLKWKYTYLYVYIYLYILLFSTPKLINNKTRMSSSTLQDDLPSFCCPTKYENDALIYRPNDLFLYLW